jgi:YhgE/Pip-like protein
VNSAGNYAERAAGEPEAGGDGGGVRQVRASNLLRVRALWAAPITLAAVIVFFMVFFYIGSVVNPTGHLSGLPVLLVNEDHGAATPSGNVNIGDQVSSELLHSPAVTSRLALDSESFAQAQAVLNRGGAYAAIVIPAGFTGALLSAYRLEGGSAGQPRILLFTNPRAGSIGVQLATGVAQPALDQVSAGIGRELTAEAAKLGRTASPRISAASPVTVTTTVFNQLPPFSALGLSAFYVSLLSIMCGFLGGVIVNTSTDAALGYGTTEFGPRWRQRVPVAISRWQTLLTKWVIACAAVPILTAILLLVSVGLLGMNAPSVWELWLFTSFAGIGVAVGTLALFAALGSLGQLVAMLLFIYLALASSGGTIPVQALPSFFRFVADFEPLRQILLGVRAILYFDAQADAGLTHGIVATAIGLVFWILVGVAVTVWYDRRGLHRLRPEVLQYAQQSARAYSEAKKDPAASGEEPAASRGPGPVASRGPDPIASRRPGNPGAGDPGPGNPGAGDPGPGNPGPGNPGPGNPGPGNPGPGHGDADGDAPAPAD